jgi:Rps23 Pro-64 3,4-dihydroxylase Tpa1-like proline 4-hydroxylase
VELVLPDFGSYLLQEAKPLSFIYEVCGALTPEVCAEIDRRFEANPEHQYQGRIGQTQSRDLSIKRSTDLTVSDKPEWKDIDRILFRSMGAALGRIRERFPFFKGPFKDMGYAIQRTNPGEYYHWHIDGGSHEFSYRQLVAVWYLNDVPGPGGETEFLFQGVKVRPEQGKLVLFPPFWTHEHRGVTLQRGVKYIATTWVVFA